MNVMLMRALIAFLPVSMLLSGSLVLFLKERTTFSLLPLLGAGCLVLVILAHVSEAVHLFSWTGWGRERTGNRKVIPTQA